MRPRYSDRFLGENSTKKWKKVQITLRGLDYLHLLYLSSADNLKINKETCAKLWDAIRTREEGHGKLRINLGRERKAETKIYFVKKNSLTTSYRRLCHGQLRGIEAHHTCQ